MLLNFKFGGGGKIRTFEDRSQRVYSPPHLTALVPLQIFVGIPTNLKAFNNKRFISIYQIIAINHFALKYAIKLT